MIFRHFRPEIIHAHSSTLFQYASGLSRCHRIPFGVTCHGLGIGNSKYQSSLSKASFIIAVGRNTARELLPLYGDKVRVVPNGIDTNLYYPRTKSPATNLFYAGRIDRTRLVMLNQLAKCTAKLDLKLTVIGDVCPRLSNVRYVPWQTNLHSILGLAPIVAACGRTAREAMASGAAVLLMNKGYCGIIHPGTVAKTWFDFSGNSRKYPEEHLEADVARLSSDHRFRTNVQKFSRSYALNYLDSKQMATQVLRQYQSALAGKFSMHCFDTIGQQLALAAWGVTSMSSRRKPWTKQ